MLRAACLTADDCCRDPQNLQRFLRRAEVQEWEQAMALSMSEAEAEEPLQLQG